MPILTQESVGGGARPGTEQRTCSPRLSKPYDEFFGSVSSRTPDPTFLHASELPVVAAIIPVQSRKRRGHFFSLRRTFTTNSVEIELYARSPAHLLMTLSGSER